ncbi:hypothetical protein [Pedobacter sp. KLB.chiD]|uniref:hypothetical protein n=1 Tax=Pedobacter sp. KLB.chiD TaxID=3387402 RepID=UPI00399BB1C3
MKTIQNSIWMRFSMLGAFSILALGFSCKKKTDYAQFAEFHYVNASSKEVKVEYPLKNFTILPSERFTIKQSDVGPKTISPEVYNDPLPLYLTGEKRDEIFNRIGTKCLISTRTSQHSLININSYTVEKINDGYYKFTYTFTEEDYDRAVACQ